MRLRRGEEISDKRWDEIKKLGKENERKTWDKKDEVG